MNTGNLIFRKILSITLSLILSGVLVTVCLFNTEVVIAQGQGKAGTTLIASKTATGFYEIIKTYDWEIIKSVSPTEVNIPKGEFQSVDYTITATRTMVEIVIYGVRGLITVTNNGERATENLKIVDVVQYKYPGSGFIDYVSYDVDLSARPILNPGETYSYPYEVIFSPKEGALYRNEAQVTITNHSGHIGTPWGPSPKEDFSLPATPTIIEIDETASVTDSPSCPAGFTLSVNTQNWNLSDSATLTYSQQITNDSAGPGTYHLDNTVTLVESDTNQIRTSDARVTITVPNVEDPEPPEPPLVEPRSQGYWKTHPNDWPMGYSPDALFFASNRTWLQVLWTASRGNMYYILAYQYIAAVLNVANGVAAPQEVLTAISTANTWFTGRNPNTPLTNAERIQIEALKDLLEAFNCPP